MVAIEQTATSNVEVVVEKKEVEVMQPKTEEPKAEEPKAEEPKAEEPKTEEPKAEEPKAEEPKAEEPKAEEPKSEEPKAEEPKAEEPKAEEPKTEEPKAEENKEETPVVEEKQEEPKAEAQAEAQTEENEKTEEKKTEEKSISLKRERSQDEDQEEPTEATEAEQQVQVAEPEAKKKKTEENKTEDQPDQPWHPAQVTEDLLTQLHTTQFLNDFEHKFALDNLQKPLHQFSPKQLEVIQGTVKQDPNTFGNGGRYGLVDKLNVKLGIVEEHTQTIHQNYEVINKLKQMEALSEFEHSFQESDLFRNGTGFRYSDKQLQVKQRLDSRLNNIVSKNLMEDGARGVQKLTEQHEKKVLSDFDFKFQKGNLGREDGEMSEKQLKCWKVIEEKLTKQGF